MKKKTTSLAAAAVNDKLELYLTSRSGLKTLMRTALALVVAAFVGVTANAATFTVTNSNDSGAGSLRQAVIDANTAVGADTIDFSGPAFTINLQSEIPITSDITIDGTTTQTVTLNGGTVFRVFNVSAGNLTASRITFFSGRAPVGQDGGCMSMTTTGTVTLNGVVFFNCSAGNGGAIRQDGGDLLIRNSTFLLNNATFQGGAILINNSGATATIVSSTFAQNNASQTGGAVRVLTGTFVTRNSMYADNTAPTHREISGNVSSQGYNLIEFSTGAVITGITTGNLLDVDAQLVGLGLNGDGTFSYVPPIGSPAVDAGDPSLANTTDQRRARRNTDGNLNGVAGVDIGAAERQRSAFDADAEETADLSVTRVVSGTSLVWYSGIRVNSSFQGLVSPSPNAVQQQQFGLSTDIPVPGDYDGDGKMDAAVYRPSQGLWYIFGSTSGLRVLAWGLAADVPVPADYDGDGKTDIGTYRAGVWYILKSQQGYTGAVTLGSATDKPVPADYDGDLKADVAVFGAGVWTMNRSTAGPTSIQFGITGDTPVPADYNGDGIDNVAVYRPNTGTWYIQKPGGYDAIPFGLATDKLVPADYDGDGKVDIAVWRSNTNSGRGDWYIQRSRDGYILTNFGFATDIPIPNALIRQ